MGRLDEIQERKEMNDADVRRVHIEANNIEALLNKVEVGNVRDEIKRRIKTIIKLTR